MPAILRHPRFADPLDEHEEDCAATIAECELPGYADAVLGFDAHRQRRGPQLLQFAAAMVGVGGVVVAMWLAKAWG